MNNNLKNIALLGLVVSLGACSQFVSAPSEFAGRGAKIENLNIRSFDQMNETMSAITDVPVSKIANMNSASTFNAAGGNGLRNQLPQGNSISQFSASQQGAIVQLAAPYCDAYVAGLVENSAAKLIAKYPFMSGFSDSTTSDFSDNNVMQLASGFYSNFWRACRSKPPLEDAQHEIMELISDLKVEFNGTDLDKPSNYMKIMCTVFLSSSCVAVY